MTRGGAECAQAANWKWGEGLGQPLRKRTSRIMTQCDRIVMAQCDRSRYGPL